MSELSRLTDAQLLGLRFSDLGLDLKGTWLESCVAKLYRELNRRRIVLRPVCFLGDQWFCPDGIPAIGIAFYLAHPRLMDLEYTMMGEAEGGTRDACMKLLRHETGHAVEHAYPLSRRKRWREIFTQATSKSRRRSGYDPGSRSFVRNLDFWYAQQNPHEDFAETFAVWLEPRSGWRRKYKDWKAIEKLLYVDALAGEIAGKGPGKAEPKVEEWDISGMRKTLRTHYRQKQAYYLKNYSDLIGRRA